MVAVFLTFSPSRTNQRLCLFLSAGFFGLSPIAVYSASGQFCQSFAFSSSFPRFVRSAKFVRRQAIMAADSSCSPVFPPRFIISALRNANAEHLLITQFRYSSGPRMCPRAFRCRCRVPALRRLFSPKSTTAVVRSHSVLIACA